jgi:hypothetical protein
MKAQRGSRDIALPFLWVVNAMPQLLYSQERGRVGPTAGLDGCRKSRPHENRSPDLPAHSELLYRLCYPGPHTAITVAIHMYMSQGYDVAYMSYFFTYQKNN